jgi:predicted component of type VI protein secretion system
LSDSSVDAIHARLVHQEEGTFFLFDENSTAGTWINYSLIPKEGAQLQHGDLIHIGKETFRISIRKPTMVRKPVITMLDETREETVR